LALVESGGKVADKEDLLRRVWQDAFVEEGSLARNVSTLRKLLGEGPRDHKYIVTVPKRGYRFVAANPTLADLTQPPYSPLCGQGLCDLSQARCIRNMSKTIPFFCKADACLMRLAGYVLVPVQDHLGRNVDSDDIRGNLSLRSSYF
jgi:hypothetical protein